MEMEMDIYLCHDCGCIQGEETEDLTCANCGVGRDRIEKINLVERVAEGLFERAMAERRTFSRRYGMFKNTWATTEAREEWRLEAYKVLLRDRSVADA